MKVKPGTDKPVTQPAERRVRTPRVAAARRVAPDRPLRVWSLLLPPSFDRK